MKTIQQLRYEIVAQAVNDGELTTLAIAAISKYMAGTIADSRDIRDKLVEDGLAYYTKGKRSRCIPLQKAIVNECHD